MKKYISRYLLLGSIIGVLVFGAILTTPVSAQNMSTCQFIETLILINVIPVQSSSTARTAFGCTTPTITASSTATTTIPTDDGRFYPSVTLIDPVITNNSVSLNGVAYPVSGELNDDWCKATNRNAGSGPFEFNWGDNSKSCSSFPATHIYQNGGQYRIEVRVKNSRGLISSRDKYVTILASTTPAATTTPYVTVLSPNGGNDFLQDQRISISFATNLTSADMSGVNLQLYNPSDSNSVTAYKNIVSNWNGGSPYSWTIPTTIAPGNYKMYITPQLLGTAVNNGLFDFSNSTFKISSSTPIVPVTVANTCVFNPEKYANFYPDIKSVLGFDSAKLRNHWLTYGIAEGRTPCGAEMPGCKFNGENYVNLYPDLKRAGVNGKTHYTQTGINEGRYICKESVTI